MIKYIFKRIISSVVTIWVVVTVTFFMMHALPGDPFTGEKKLPPQVKANMEEKYGLNKPLSQQYVTYLSRLVKGDLGLSIINQGRTVNEIIAYSFPTSAKLGGVAVLFSLILGILMGIVAALKQGKWQDNLSMVISTIGVTVPSFVMATLLIYFFAVKLQLLPAIGFDGPKNYILPAIALGGSSMAFIARLARSSLLEVIRQDYIRVAKAKGLSKFQIVYKHALRNSLIPIVTYLGPLVAAVLTGSFVVESMFGIPGLGREFVVSIGNRDYTEILGVTIFYGSFLVICNLIVDILYVVIDPRIKLES
ncbi:ABC transporter permease [Clostridium sp. SYSU_GA19001]|uniref:ABC transporter permease n=1 Tax=Clostridium caldaquaticum TaxID=2940653 RepID=UPI002076DB57|nr:ABC transporter permease [Clostridium caldaquaticum]MCM8711992.1 ABC transporter permease [Clostridium caldaquaticum]